MLNNAGTTAVKASGVYWLLSDGVMDGASAITSTNTAGVAKNVSGVLC